MNALTVEAMRLARGLSGSMTESLAVEAPLRILVNETPFTVTMRTPGGERALARGLLLTEGIVPDSSAHIEWREERGSEGLITAVNAALPPESVAKSVDGLRSLASSTSCGLCGALDAPDLADLGPPLALDSPKWLNLAMLESMFALMWGGQTLFQRTGGSHSAAIFNSTGIMLSLAEDVGRHNAVDKAVGGLVISGSLSRAAALLVSGRVSFEIVLKAWRAGVPVIAAVSAPTSLAVAGAARLGVTLLGFCRDGRAVAYTHTGRIVVDDGLLERGES